MNYTDVRTRFAPSPTGELHLGNARTALFNALLAMRNKGKFFLRIEDTDAERSSQVYTDALQRDLHWLGLRWEGGEDGSVDVVRQSERSEVYARYYRQLESAASTYPCFCTPGKLKAAREEQRARGLPPRYPGTCANLEPSEIESRLAEGQRPALRFRVPREGDVGFDDLVRGAQRFRCRDIGDFVIQRADGTAAFLFSNAIDDALMKISHVLRGEDHLANTPRQLLILGALGFAAPRYGHLSLITGPDSRPLSKRHGDHSLRELREGGYLPAAVLNYLARLGHVYDEDRLFTLDALATAFDVNRLGKSPAQHDAGRLDFWQQEALKILSDDEVLAWLNEHIQGSARHLDDVVPEGRALAFVATIRDNIAAPDDAAYWAAVLFGNDPDFDARATEVLRTAGPEFFAQALDRASAANVDFGVFAKSVGKATGAKGKNLYMPLRAALTGYRYERADARWQHGPELGRIWSLLGSEEVCRRLERARHCSSEQV